MSLALPSDGNHKDETSSDPRKEERERCGDTSVIPYHDQTVRLVWYLGIFFLASEYLLFHTLYHYFFFFPKEGQCLVN